MTHWTCILSGDYWAHVQFAYVLGLTLCYLQTQVMDQWMEIIKYHKIENNKDKPDLALNIDLL